MIAAVQRRRAQLLFVGALFVAALSRGATGAGQRAPGRSSATPSTTTPPALVSAPPSAKGAGAPAASPSGDRANRLHPFSASAVSKSPPPRLAQVARCGGAPTPLPAPHARPICEGNPSSERLRILHVGDMHGHWQPYLHGHSPFAYLRAFADDQRRESAGRLLFLDAGDDLEKGALAEYRSSGEASVAMLDQLGLDARTLGNHDFGYGVASVLAQSASSVHDVLGSNLVYAPTDGSPGEFRAKRTVVYAIGCVRVGVFGLTINPYDETDERVDEPYLGVFAQRHDPASADRYVGVATELVSELRERDGADFVIGLDHLGAALDKQLIDGVPGLDLVISAHDHVAIQGYMAGRHGIAVDSGSFLGAEKNARVGVVDVEIDLRTKDWRLVSADQRAVGSLGRVDAAVDAEARRLTECFAPDAEEPVADLAAPLSSPDLGAWLPVFDAALKKRFPSADALLYEAWAWGGVFKGSLPAGHVTPQSVLDAMFVEHERSGGAGFTAFVEVPVTGGTLAEMCKAKLAEPDGWKKVRRLCPPFDAIALDRTYRLVVERRPLHAPTSVLDAVPEGFPREEAALGPPAEAYEIFLDYARDRGRQCLAIDADVKTRCFGADGDSLHD